MDHRYYLFLPLLICHVITANSDITNDRQYGCIWTGGLSTGVKCTCTPEAKEMIIAEGSIPVYETFSIEIIDCSNVTFATNAIAAMRNLRQIRIENVAWLDLSPSSLQWQGYTSDANLLDNSNAPTIEITISNSTVNRLGSDAFSGRIGSVNFNRVTFQSMEAFAFNALQYNREISFHNCILNAVAPQTFKKFTTGRLKFDGVSARLIPSRFVSNVSVEGRLDVENCHFDTVRPGAFLSDVADGFRLINTTVRQLDGEAFKIHSSSDVYFKDNVFQTVNDRALAGITPNLARKPPESITFYLVDNVISTLSRDSLEINGEFRTKLTNLQLDEPCDCTMIDHKLKNGAFHDEIRCSTGEVNYDTVKSFRQAQCSLVQSYSTTIVIVGVIGTLCIIILTLLVLYYKRVYLSRKYGNEKVAKSGNNTSLIVPDGRTYRETEVHVIVERADLLTTDL